MLDVIREGSDDQIRERYIQDVRRLIQAFSPDIERYVLLALFDQAGSIGSFHANQVFTALSQLNGKRERDVLLLIASPGGKVEPAYQISKLCREFSRERFIVAVPRQAKSAATLIAIGADEIHMGPLGELGPIDPQLDNLPALGVVQALERIASLAQQFPGSSEMFAEYLRRTVTVEQIGYCERISESAVQYAERLLATKADLTGRANEVARRLVYEYKDHSFVVDRDEAARLLGERWIVRESKELWFSETAYRLLDSFASFLELFRDKDFRVIGELEGGIWVWDRISR